MRGGTSTGVPHLAFLQINAYLSCGFRRRGSPFHPSHGICPILQTAHPLVPLLRAAPQLKACRWSALPAPETASFWGRALAGPWPLLTYAGLPHICFLSENVHYLSNSWVYILIDYKLRQGKRGCVCSSPLLLERPL